MNRIYKVIYSKVRQCYVAVSELAKNQGKKAGSEHTMRENNHSYRLAAIVALAISTGSLLYPMQAEAGTDLSTNDYFTAYDKNYFDQDGKKSDDWKAVTLSNTDQDEKNVGAKGTGAIAAGLFAQAGQQTVTIGNRDAAQSMGSVFIGEYKGYINPDGNLPKGLGNNYVTSVGFMSNATKYGTIAIGAGASAEGEINNVEFGNTDSSGAFVSSLPDPENLTIHGASVSLGYSAKSKSGNIAIGAYSDATTDLSADTSETAKSYLTKESATSYVSVGNKDVQRRISNVADGAADSDAATIAQLKEAVKETDASNKANIDASNIGNNLTVDPVYQTDEEGAIIKGSDDQPLIDEEKTTAKRNEDQTTNKNAWGAAIGTGSIADPTKSEKNDPAKNGSQQLVTGGTVYNALQQQADNLKVNAGWGINVNDVTTKDGVTETTTKNVISLNRNLGTNYADKAHNGDGKVTVAVADTGLVLGGYAEDEKGNKNNPAVTYGATGDDSVTVGGKNSLASGKGSVITGGVENIASGATAVAIGGNNNDAIGTRSAVLGGLDNTAFGDNSMVSGGGYNVAGGIQSAVLCGFSNYALGTGTTSIGGYGKYYETGHDSSVNGNYSVGVAGGSTGKDAKYALAAGHQTVVTTENGTAIGY